MRASASHTTPNPRACNKVRALQREEEIRIRAAKVDALQESSVNRMKKEENNNIRSAVLCCGLISEDAFPLLRRTASAFCGWKKQIEIQSWPGGSNEENYGMHTGCLSVVISRWGRRELSGGEYHVTII